MNDKDEEITVRGEWTEGDDVFIVKPFPLKADDFTPAQWDKLRRLHAEIFLSTSPSPSKRIQ